MGKKKSGNKTPSKPEAASTKSCPCKICGKTPTEACARCHAVHYCSKACQRSDWDEHQHDCDRNDGVSICDECKKGSWNDLPGVCYACGHIMCGSCNKKCLVHGSFGMVMGFLPCPSCGAKNGLKPHDRKNWKSLDKLVKQEDKYDALRRAKWLVYLAQTYRVNSIAFPKVKETYEKAGELGLGEGYSRLAEVYKERKEWDLVELNYEKGAALDDSVAFYFLAMKADLGYFFPEQDEEDTHIPQDHEKAFRLMKQAAKLDHAAACSGLGRMYKEGIGVEVDPEKAVKWYRKSAEKGNAEGMRRVGKAYCEGYGPLQQDYEQAMFWFGKAAAEGDEHARLAYAQLASQLRR